MIPQAFTTRDMSEAYRWLHTLPPTVREEMKTMEQVVMMYLKAKRMGGGMPLREDLESLKNQPPPAPVITESSKPSEFQKTLKNLKTELDRFDFSAQSVTIPQAPMPQPLRQEPAPQPQEEHPVAPPPFQGQADGSRQNILSAMRMDPRSRQIINEIREGLNLGSDVEVLRMSLVLAHKTLRDLLK